LACLADGGRVHDGSEASEVGSDGAEEEAGVLAADLGEVDVLEQGCRETGEGGLKTEEGLVGAEVGQVG
jgi:hypothetical protein